MIGNTVLAGATRLVLGERLGGGGEGEVHAVRGHANRAVKIYFPKKRPERLTKIAAMIDRQLAAKSRRVSFPMEQVSSTEGEFLGFTMRRISGYRIIFDLWHPQQRASHFATADFRFLVHAAANAARAIAGVHYADCVVGDLNESGLLVSPQATVALIDADSFQFRHAGAAFLCDVGKAEFTAPELSGPDPYSRPRGPNHDSFALAGVIFRLLFLGRNPFAGPIVAVGIELEDAQAQHRFAFSLRRNTGLAAPRRTPALGDVSAELADLFEAAFAPAGTLGLRPRPLDWADALDTFEGELGACGVNKRHWFHPQAGTCPWCRIVRQGGADPFP